MADELYDASLTITSKIPYVKKIYEKLNVARRAIFEQSCFGCWFRLSDSSADPALIHSFLQLETFPEDAEPNTLYYKVGNLPSFRYGPEEFCLITGLRFGEEPALPEVVGHESAVTRIFGNGKLLVRDVLNVFDTIGRNDILTNEDAVRVCLLVMVDVFFLGRKGALPVMQTSIRAIEDLETWNNYPWGSYIWKPTYKQMSRAIQRRSDRKSKMTMSGFLFPFKIWIVETFPACVAQFTQTDRLPRAVSWDKTNRLLRDHIEKIIDVHGEHMRGRAPPLRRLRPTAQERGAVWYRQSVRYIRRMARGGGDRDDNDYDSDDDVHDEDVNMPEDVPEPHHQHGPHQQQDPQNQHEAHEGIPMPESSNQFEQGWAAAEAVWNQRWNEWEHWRDNLLPKYIDDRIANWYQRHEALQQQQRRRQQQQQQEQEQQHTSTSTSNSTSTR